MERQSLETKRLIIFILLIFYTVGISIHLTSYFTDIIKFLTPSFLLFTSLIVFFEDKPSKKFLIWFAFSYFITTFIEVLGVKTGLIFGQYQYNQNLGVKIFDVPVVIGLNWVILILAAVGFVEGIKSSLIIKSFLSGLIMIMFDLLLEIAAPKLNYWSFINGYPPVQNYLSWFIISFILGYIFQALKIQRTFSIARFNLIFQFFFFLTILLFKKH